MLFCVFLFFFLRAQLLFFFGLVDAELVWFMVFVYPHKLLFLQSFELSSDKTLRLPDFFSDTFDCVVSACYLFEQGFFAEFFKLFFCNPPDFLCYGRVYVVSLVEILQ